MDQSPVFTDFSEIDAQLAAAGLNGAIGMIEYYTVDGAGEFARTVIASDRGNKQLAFDWVPGDPRRGGRTNITYMVDQGEGIATGNPMNLTNVQTEPAIDRAMDTWNGVRCSNLPIDKLLWNNLDLGAVQFFAGFGGAPFVFADLMHAGWLPAPFFNTAPFFPPNGATFILGVTFTFGFLDGGNFTDIDGDGKLDTLLREIYYNNNFTWAIDTNTFPFIDVETVAFHEAGHGLSQAHFGDIFLDAGGGKVHFAPRAVMNAAYSGLQQSPTGTDIAGHCSIWGSWPNN